MNTSWNGLKFICCREAFVAVAYPDDTTGGGRCSIGFGSQTPAPKLGDTITFDEAFRRLRAKTDANDVQIARALAVPVSQGTWDALASLLYQAGSKALASVAAAINAHGPEIGVMELAAWNHGQNGVPTAGHSKRRAREIIMAIDGFYGDVSHYLAFNGNPREVSPVSTEFPNEMPT